MSSTSSHDDKYEEYNYEQDKLTGHGGKGISPRPDVK